VIQIKEKNTQHRDEEKIRLEIRLRRQNNAKDEPKTRRKVEH
jgi:hypothetical protein